MDRACGDIETLKKVLDYGISLEFDTIGRFKYHSDVRELELIRQILDWGYENQLLFSLDTTRERLKTYTARRSGTDVYFGNISAGHERIRDHRAPD